MHDEIEGFMAQLCEAGADAIRRYVGVSGESYETMPEYFLASTIFSTVGSTRAVTLETPLWQLHAWQAATGAIPEIDAELSRCRLDMILYEGGSSRPHDQSVWALVEIKNGYIDADVTRGRRSDREKLWSVMSWFPVKPPYLICCGSLNAERRRYHEERAAAVGDIWFEAKTGQLEHIGGEAFFGARVIVGPRVA